MTRSTRPASPVTTRSQRSKPETVAARGHSDAAGGQRTGVGGGLEGAEAVGWCLSQEGGGAGRSKSPAPPYYCRNRGRENAICVCNGVCRGSGSPVTLFGFSGYVVRVLRLRCSPTEPPSDHLDRNAGYDAPAVDVALRVERLAVPVSTRHPSARVPQRGYRLPCAADFACQLLQTQCRDGPAC